MKTCFTFIIVFIAFGIASCKKDPPVAINRVTSPEFEDNLLFVNKTKYTIQTNETAEFSSADPHIQIDKSGQITRLLSGVVVPIDITWPKRDGLKTRIYALGATDNTHDQPFATFHDREATDPYNAYRQGWKTLRKLPVNDETYAIILRHADASTGADNTAGPADWWKSCDPQLARQLNTDGIIRATALGKIFKDLNYQIERIISSEFCRAVSTAQLVNAGPEIVLDSRINHPNHNRNNLFSGMIEIISAFPVDNKITLVVTHHPINETPAANYPTFPKVSPFNWTGAYLIKIDPDKTITYQGAVSLEMFEYWRNLKLKLIQ
ncbi:MAG TPA: histidine phosphatase family protein [Daejeonella sp.]|nr:histidine phosphatase family protein [Daejeonella sp.]